MLIKFNPGLLRVFKLAIIAVFSCHFFGCVWWFVSDIEMAPPDAVRRWSLPPGAGAGMTEDDVDNGWWPAPWLKHSGRLELKYFHAFYWGAGIALGMTPIDIVPMTTVEAVVTTVLLFFGLLLNAFVISSFTSAFAAIDKKNQLAGKQLDVIRNYLLLKAVPADVRSRILEYFQYIYTSSQSMDEVSQLQHMPPSLTTQLALSVNRELIRNCDFFCDVSNTALVAIVMRLEPLVFVPGQVIAAEGAPLHHIYFINRGKVEVYARLGQEDELGAPTEELVMTLSENDNIGMDEYLGLGHRGSDRGSARSRTTSSSGGAAGPVVAASRRRCRRRPRPPTDGSTGQGVRSASPVAGAPHGRRIARGDGLHAAVGAGGLLLRRDAPLDGRPERRARKRLGRARAARSAQSRSGAEKESRREAGGSRFWQVSRLACTLGRKPHLKRDKSAAASIAADGGGASSSSFSAVSRRDEADARRRGVGGGHGGKTDQVGARPAQAKLDSRGGHRSGGGGRERQRHPEHSTPAGAADAHAHAQRCGRSLVLRRRQRGAALHRPRQVRRRAAGRLAPLVCRRPANDARQRGRRCTFHQDVSVPSAAAAPPPGLGTVEATRAAAHPTPRAAMATVARRAAAATAPPPLAAGATVDAGGGAPGGCDDAPTQPPVETNHRSVGGFLTSYGPRGRGGSPLRRTLIGPRRVRGQRTLRISGGDARCRAIVCMRARVGDRARAAWVLRRPWGCGESVESCLPPHACECIMRWQQHRRRCM